MPYLFLTIVETAKSIDFVFKLPLDELEEHFLLQFLKQKKQVHLAIVYYLQRSQIEQAFQLYDSAYGSQTTSDAISVQETPLAHLHAIMQSYRLTYKDNALLSSPSRGTEQSMGNIISLIKLAIIVSFSVISPPRDLVKREVKAPPVKGYSTPKRQTFIVQIQTNSFQ